MELKYIVDELKKDCGIDVSIEGNTDRAVCGVSNDSRKVGENYIFAARKGTSVDSNSYIGDALAAGVSAVLTDKDDHGLNFDGYMADTAFIKADNPLKAYSVVSRTFFNNPGKDMPVIGITGTNGKTTTTFLVKSILEDFGLESGLIGTIGYKIGERCFHESGNTTPDAFELNRVMREIADFGKGSCVMEVSSHSLVQERVYGIPFDIAVFTNLTRDHLDYHDTMENYYEAKKKMFSEVLFKSGKPNKFAIINNDDFYGKRLLGELKNNPGNGCGGSPYKIITYGLSADSDIYAGAIKNMKSGLEFSVNLPGNEKIEVFSGLIGHHNAYNILASVSVAFALSVPPDNMESGIKNLRTVPGRVERVVLNSDDLPVVCIDYAHTDDALERVLRSLKELGSRGRLISVFGCGGDRDKGKRPLMGKHSSGIADITIITSDNPRSENPELIMEDIEKGIENARYINLISGGEGGLEYDVKELNGHVYTKIADRAEAIRTALKISGKEDIVLIAGKGHENYMIVNDKKSHFSDREEVLKFYENCI